MVHLFNLNLSRNKKILDKDGLINNRLSTYNNCMILYLFGNRKNLNLYLNK